MSTLNHSFFERKLKQLWKYYKANYKMDKVTLAEKQWYDDLGDATLRFDYDLNENSVIIDLGAYLGDFSHQMVSMFNPYIYTFEPVDRFYQIIKKDFAHNPKVKVSNLAMSNVTGEQSISVIGVKSSLHLEEGDKKELINTKDVKAFIEQNNLEEVDLMKINIEGGEYEVLERLIDTGFIKRIKNMQIQFHKVAKDSVERRDKIIKELEKTHENTFSYYFIWEGWRLKE